MEAAAVLLVIGGLNDEWLTEYESWDVFSKTEKLKRTVDNSDDFDAIYQDFAEQFYSVCAKVSKQAMPNHLYLGSRVHVCPSVVAEAALKHVDVYSLNYFSPLAGVGSVPIDADRPVMITEYHFGAVDRVVPGTGLMGAHDQRE